MDLQDKVQLFRRRFKGRQDVYGCQWQIKNKEGKIAKGYAPVCENIWKDFCHRKLKDGVQCPKCEHRKWAPVTDDSVTKHIMGDEAHIYYVLQSDGNINFGAMDFDMKPGKEDKGYGFDEVKKVSQKLDEMGIQHYIARSTGEGFHLYVFFKDPYPANKFRSFILWFFGEIGFMQYVLQGIKPLPEFFPKQSYVGHDGIGNGIKPPMIETRFQYGRNGFVDRNNTFIGEGGTPEEISQAQWKYFSEATQQSVEDFDKVLEKHKIPVLEEISQNSATTASGTPHSIYGHSAKQGPWQPPLSGSIEKVLEGCAALRKKRDNVLKGEVPGHETGFALFHMCMHTMDGMDWFKKHVKGWGETDQDIKQLQQSLDRNYLPATCRKLQEKGICDPGTQCFEKKPPLETVDGVQVYRDDIPRDKWPEPSPIRYAYGKGEDYLEKLKAEATDISGITDLKMKTDTLKEIVRRAQAFDEDQQKDLKKHIRSLKPMKRNELSKIFNEASEAHAESVKSNALKRSDTVRVDDQIYLKNDLGYSIMKKVKGSKPTYIKLCSVDIWIKEVRFYQEEGTTIKSMYAGTVKAPGMEKSFEIEIADWCENAPFMRYFSQILGNYWSPLRVNLEFIRQAAVGFSEKIGIERKSYHLTQGFYDSTYLMPSCVVDANGVRPNTTQKVELSWKETRQLDFQILPEQEVKELLLHVKTDFLVAWPKLWTFTGIAHTLLPGIMKAMGWSKRPTLFYEGLTGCGKSELTHALQYFWGNFKSIANFMSSPKAVRELGYQFKDATLVVDDYKGLSREQKDAIRQCILNAYDGTTDFKLQRNADFRTPKATRGVYTMSGEEFVTNDAAVIARTILLEVKKHDTLRTQGKYEKVVEKRESYNAITPQFISWFLRQNKTAIKSYLKETRQKLREPHIGAQNIDRITGNLAVNFVVWKMFSQFMVDLNTASASEKETMDELHWSHVSKLRDDMVERCSSELAAEVFLQILEQLLGAGEVSIRGLANYDNEYKVYIGYVPKDQPPSGSIHLYPNVVYEVVKKNSQNQPIPGTTTAIARQLNDLKVFAETDKNRNYKQVRLNDKRSRVWALRPEALGIEPKLVKPNRGDVQEEKKGKVFQMPRQPREEDFGVF